MWLATGVLVVLVATTLVGARHLGRRRAGRRPRGSVEAMDDTVATALERDRVVDITTTGRHSGEPRRLEIWIHHLGGRHYITGTPGRRAWYANLVADPASCST